MIHYVQGDATDPQVPGEKVIAHVCNDIGGWGRGFVLSLSRKWPKAEADYRNWFQGNDPLDVTVPPYPLFALGSVGWVRVTDNIWVANMIAQHGVRPNEGISPIRYEALEECLKNVAAMGASVHMPRIGCGLAGGKWSDIEPIIERAMPNTDVYVYDFDTKDARTIPWNK